MPNGWKKSLKIDVIGKKEKCGGSKKKEIRWSSTKCGSPCKFKKTNNSKRTKGAGRNSGKINFAASQWSACPWGCKNGKIVARWSRRRLINDELNMWNRELQQAE
jgi:hypothetical protein